MPEKPEILSTTTVASSRLFHIESLRLRFSNGAEREFERLRSNRRGMVGAVMIVPFLANNRILLVREYAAGIDRYELGFPKGLIEPTETPLEAANRELMEEIGFGAKQLSVLRVLATSPAYMGSQMAIIAAEDLYPQKLPGDEPEPIEIVEWPMAELDNLLMQDDVTDARTLAALLLIQTLVKERTDVE